MNLSRFSRSALLCPVVCWISQPNALAQAPCPVTCYASTAGDSMVGSIPTGVTYAVITAVAQNGSATSTCVACRYCQRDLAVIFNGNGSGWCMAYQINSDGWSSSLPQYSRPGSQMAICGGKHTTDFRILDCATGAMALEQHLELSCACDD